MLKRDSLTAQMQQLSHTLAKVKRLIVEKEEVEARSVLQEVLGEYYRTNLTDLLETPAHLFIQQLKQQDFKQEELGLLADFLDELATIETDDSVQRLIWQRVILIYDVLE